MSEVNIGIESTGKPFGTKVFYADTGQEIKNVDRVEINIDMANGGAPKITIYLWEGAPIMSTIVEGIHSKSQPTGE